MAIYHCSLRVFSRANGDSAVAAAAYRAGAVIHDERAGHTHRYQNRKGVVSSFIVAPADAPENTYTRALLWNAAERAETRKNSRVAREVILALPHELPAPARETLIRDMAGWLVERYRVAVDVAIHSPVVGDGHDPRNHHAHLLFTTREITKDGLGKKTRILDDREQGPQEVELIRTIWETLANDALEQAGLSHAKIDRRTLDDQGLDRIPQIHIGPESKANKEKSGDKDDTDGEDGDKDGGDEGGKSGGQSGKQGGGSGDKSPAPASVKEVAAKEKEAVSQKRDVDYKTIDQGRRRSDFVEEIKRLNERRAAFSDIPLKNQIADIERLIEKLDTRVHKLETLKEKTGFGQRILSSLSELVKISKNLFLGREEYRGAVKLSETERATRAERQREYYGREYRAGLHEQIKTMRSNLDRLEQLKTSCTAYKGFVEKLEKDIVSTQPSITTLHREQAKPETVKTPPREKPARIITAAELSIKLTLKAEMVREIVPPGYKSKNAVTGKIESIPSLKAQLNKTAAPPIDLTNSFREQIIPTPREQSQNIASYKQPIKLEIKELSKAIEQRQQFPVLKQESRNEQPPNPADRKNWFIPASEKTNPLQESINKTIAEQRRVIPAPSPERVSPNTLKGQFHTQAKAEPPPRQVTHEEVRERTRAEAQAKRENIPPQYRAEPYEEPKQPKIKTAYKPQNNSVKNEWKARAEPNIESPNQEHIQKPRQKMSSGFNAASNNGTHLPHPAKPDAAAMGDEPGHRL